MQIMLQILRMRNTLSWTAFLEQIGQAPSTDILAKKAPTGELNCLDPHLAHSQKTLPSSTFFLIPGTLAYTLRTLRSAVINEVDP